MIFSHALQKAELLDLLIRTESTGRPEVFARKLNISSRTLFHYLADLKDLGAPIQWSSFRNSYYYTVSGKLWFGFQADQAPRFLEYDY